MTKKLSAEKDYILEMLHELQDRSPANFLSEKDLKQVADSLNTTYSHVYGVATYYTMFSLKPRGKYIIRICNSPVCSMEGSESITDVLKELLGVRLGETTEDGLFSIEKASCLGHCDIAPSMMVGKDVYGELSRDRIMEILAQYK